MVQLKLVWVPDGEVLCLTILQHTISCWCLPVIDASLIGRLKCLEVIYCSKTVSSQSTEPRYWWTASQIDCHELIIRFVHNHCLWCMNWTLVNTWAVSAVVYMDVAQYSHYCKYWPRSIGGAWLAKDFVLISHYMTCLWQLLNKVDRKLIEQQYYWKLGKSLPSGMSFLR